MHAWYFFLLLLTGKPDWRLKKIHKLLCVYQEVAGSRMDWEFWISVCKLLYREETDNKVIRYSTRNYIQYPVKTIIEKM